VVDRHAAQPPFARHYWWVVVVALLGLAPYIVLTTSSPLLQQSVASGTHSSMLQGQLAEALSNAGYAFGAVLASWLVQRFRQRILFLGTETLFVVGSGIAAGAVDPAMFMTGRIAQGAATGLMLVIALPPLITRFPASRMPVTSTVVNLGLFGAVTAGPLLGGAAANGDGWRWLFGGTAVLGIVGIVLAALSLERFAPFNPERPGDFPAFGLALAATVLPFFGVAHLVTTGFADPLVWTPVAAGLALLLALIVLQRLRSDALMPIRPVLRAIPLTGLLVAMVAGAVVVAAFELVVPLLQSVQHTDPLTTGLLFWPALAGVAVTATVFGRLVHTRFIPVLVVVGMALLIGATYLLTADTSHVAILAATGLLGAGAGATVSPGLFTAAWAVDSTLVGRVFALVELLRSESAYLVGPVLLHLMKTHGAPAVDLVAGFHESMLIDLAVAAGGTALVVAWFLLSGARLQRPDLQQWLAGQGDQAIDSPASGALVTALVAAGPEGEQSWSPVPTP
jgi:predicted MFS family arabinose efflux permease